MSALIPLTACVVIAIILLLAFISANSTGMLEVRGGRVNASIRGIRLSNRGSGVLRISKVGLYQTLDDATQNKKELLETNAPSVEFYTQGVVSVKGQMIDVANSRYDEVSSDHYVALRSGESLLVDLRANVPFAAIRLGAVDSSVAPDQRRLMVETSANYTDISTASFVAGFVRFRSVVPGQASKFMSRSGLYEFATTEAGLSPVATRSVSQTIALGARWVKQAPTWVRPTSGIDNPSDLSYSSDGSTLTVAAPSCNGPWPHSGTMMFSDFASHVFTGDFTLILKFTNGMFGMFNVFSSPTLSLDVLSMMPKKVSGQSAVYPYEAWIGPRPGFANVGSDCGLMLAGYGNPENLRAYGLGCVFLSSATTLQLTGRICYGVTTPGTFYVRFVRSGNTLTPSISGDGQSWNSTPPPRVLEIMGGMDPMNPVAVPSDHKVMVGFSPYDWTQGNAPFRSITLSCPFQFPTSATFVPTRVSANQTTTLTLTAVGHDVRMNSSCALYLVASDVSTLVGSGTLATNGTVVVSCTFANPGEFDLVFRITSGAGLTSDEIACASSLTVVP